MTKRDKQLRKQRRAYEKRKKGKNGGPGPRQTPSPYEREGRSSPDRYDDRFWDGLD